MAQVIVLNGASSAGKTTLGRALQDRLAEPYLLLGLDTCFQMVPDRWAGGPEGEFRHDGFAYLDLPPQDGHPTLGIGYGPVGWRMMSGFRREAGRTHRLGLARWSAARVHAGVDYDLTVDTTTTAPAQCAQVVAAAAETADPP
ncbi:MAG TPA: hypothetical protein VFR11_18495 [Micromonosporaceae bacterium]|nr:hypothetical protein [Micromonosporaceae bacterium]